MFIGQALTNTQRTKIINELVYLLESLTAASHDLCHNIKLGRQIECIRPARFLRGPVYMKRILLLTPTGLTEVSVEGVMDDYSFLAGTKPPSNKNFSSSDFNFVANTYSLDTEALKDVLNKIKA